MRYLGGSMGTLIFGQDVASSQQLIAAMAALPPVTLEAREFLVENADSVRPDYRDAFGAVYKASAQGRQEFIKTVGVSAGVGLALGVGLTFLSKRLKWGKRGGQR